jgi:hypothetical protein
MRELGREIRFSVSRGPLNIASFLMGMTEFMIALKTKPIINLYDPGVHRSIAEIVEWTEGRVAILGGIPPRDVLAAGSPKAVFEAVRSHLAFLDALR